MQAATARHHHRDAAVVALQLHKDIVALAGICREILDEIHALGAARFAENPRRNLRHLFAAQGVFAVFPAFLHRPRRNKQAQHSNHHHHRNCKTQDRRNKAMDGLAAGEPDHHFRIAPQPRHHREHADKQHQGKQGGQVADRGKAHHRPDRRRGQRAHRRLPEQTHDLRGQDDEQQDDKQPHGDPGQFEEQASTKNHRF